MLRSFLEVTIVPHQMAAGPHPSPSVCLLAWCGFAAPLSTSTAERADFQGFGTTSTRRAGPTASGPVGRSPSTTQHNVELEMMQLPLASRQICYRDPDCADRAQWPRPDLQWPCLRLLSFSEARAAGELSHTLALPPARVAPPAPPLALQSAGNAHVDGWRVTFTPTGWQASHRVHPDRTPAGTEILRLFPYCTVST